MKFDEITVTMPLAQLDEMRAQISKADEERAVLEKAIKRIFQTDIATMCERFYEMDRQDRLRTLRTSGAI